MGKKQDRLNVVREIRYAAEQYRKHLVGRKFLYAGKSGSVRVIYIDFEVLEQIFFVDVFAKDKKENLTQGERNDMRKIVKLIELSLEDSK